MVHFCYANLKRVLVFKVAGFLEPFSTPEWGCEVPMRPIRTPSTLRADYTLLASREYSSCSCGPHLPEIGKLPYMVTVTKPLHFQL